MSNYLLHREKAIAAILIVAVFYSLFGPIVRMLDSDFTVLQQVYLRTAVGALIGLLFWGSGLWRTIIQGVSSYEIGLIVLRAACLTLGGTVLFTFAAIRAPLGIVAFLGALPSAAIWQCIFSHRLPSGAQTLGLTLGSVGLALILLPAVGETSNHDLVGLMAATGSGLIFSFGLVSRQLHRQQWHEGQLGLLLMIGGSILTIAFSLIAGEGYPALEWGQTSALLLGLGVIIALAVRLSGYAFSNLAGSEAGVLLMMEVPCSALLGFFLYQEVPGSLELLGGVFVLVAGIIVTLFGKHQECVDEQIKLECPKLCRSISVGAVQDPAGAIRGVCS